MLFALEFVLQCLIFLEIPLRYYCTAFFQNDFNDFILLSQ